LLDENHIDKYGEDIFSFKNDADQCFKYLSKIRGKRRESTDMHAYFNEMLEQDFPELFVTPNDTIVYDTGHESGRKRSRPSLSGAIAHSETKLPDRKASRVSDANSAAKKEEVAARTSLPSKVKVACTLVLTNTRIIFALL